MFIFQLLARLPIDLGQSAFKHKTKSKLIAFNCVPEPVPGARALDVGCGDGYWSKKLKERGYETISIDQHRQYPNIDADFEFPSMIPVDINKSLPFPNNYFDIVWCSEVVEHLKNFHYTISEMQRVTKPDGRLIITTPNSFFWLHYVFKCFGIDNSDWQNEGHINFFNLRDIKRLFPKAIIYGYFPYMIIKFRIKRFIGILSPNFIIISDKEYPACWLSYKS